MTNSIITRKAQLNALGLEDLPEMAQDLVLSQPANVQARVESRKKHVLGCLEVVQNTLARKDKGASILTATCELLGTGGHNDLGTQWGGESARLPWFATCGTGRRHAHDGSAWTDAIRMALHELVEDYADNPDSRNGELVLRWDPEFGDVDLAVRYQTTGEVKFIEQPFSLDESWEKDSAEPIMELGLARSMRALCGQLLVALTRDQIYLALTDADVSESGIAWKGIAIDEESFKAPGALKAVGEGFEYWSHKF